MNGAVYVAYGEKAQYEAEESIATLREHNPGLSISVVSDQQLSGVGHISFDKPGPGARWAKLNLDLLSPYGCTLYIDADTRIHGSVVTGFDILADGWDLAIAPSHRQGKDCLGHLLPKEKQRTLEALDCEEPLNLQAGVFFFRKSGAVHRFFEMWRTCWGRFEDQDQGALMRALAREPVRVWMLSNEWNGQRGGIVEHRFGAAR